MEAHIKTIHEKTKRLAVVVTGLYSEDMNMREMTYHLDRYFEYVKLCKDIKKLIRFVKKYSGNCYDLERTINMLDHIDISDIYEIKEFRDDVAERIEYYNSEYIY